MNDKLSRPDLRPATAVALPTCAKCRKKVDQMLSFRNNAACTLLLEVRCHGDVQRVELTDELLCDKAGNIRFDGLAFADSPELAAKTPGRLPE